jgi:hypothetical protein
MLLAIGIALAACASSGQVFADSVGGGSGVGSRNTTADIEDLGLGQLHSLTSNSVRVLGISLVSVPRAVRLLTTHAYAPSFSVGLVDGNLAKLCRKISVAHPLTDTTAAPHADTNYGLVLAFRFTKPGQYSLHRVKISYETDGQKGWQYEHLNFTATVTAAAPGTKSHFSGCP